MGKQLITERTVKELLAKGSKTLEVPKGALITPLAAELVLAEGIKLVEPMRQTTPTDVQSVQKVYPTVPGDELKSPGNMVAFGSDHGGFQLKESLKKHAESLGYLVMDVGTYSEDPCDYPDFAYSVAIAVAEGKAWRGVMVDGAGIGSCVVANKVPGVRAACCHNEFVARNAREHNDTNVLTLGSRVVGSEVCKEIMRVWLETLFAGGRHKQRVAKIVDVEQRFLK
jgi:ribose 5-phosphate isomerase B